jgi:exodeoxyribonuclease III
VLLVSWNVARRVKSLEAQFANVLALGADLICLQEITVTTLPVWEALLSRAGYSVQHASPDNAPAPARSLMVLTACREALSTIAIVDVPFPERVLAVRLCDGTEVVNVHSPISSVPDLAKLRTHLAVFEHLARADARSRVLCGDLNTPRREHRDGTVWTFARDRYGRLREDRGTDWDRAELALLRGLEQFGFRDAFRALHGYEHREISWGWSRWPGGYRLDHLLVAGLEIQRCDYRNDWREAGLSDHAALVATLDHVVGGAAA